MYFFYINGRELLLNSVFILAQLSFKLNESSCVVML